MAQAPVNGKQIEVEIHTDTYKIQGTLFVPMVSVGSYSGRLSDFLNNTEKQFLALTNVSVVALPDPEVKWQSPFIALNKSVVTMIRTLKE